MLVGATSVTLRFLFMAQPSKQGLIRQVVIFFFPNLDCVPQETEFNLLLTSTHILILHSGAAFRFVPPVFHLQKL